MFVSPVLARAHPVFNQPSGGFISMHLFNISKNLLCKVGILVSGSGKGVQNLMGLYKSHNGWDHYGSWLVVLRNQNQTLLSI